MEDNKHSLCSHRYLAKADTYSNHHILICLLWGKLLTLRGTYLLNCIFHHLVAGIKNPTHIFLAKSFSYNLYTTLTRKSEGNWIFPSVIIGIKHAKRLESLLDRWWKNENYAAWLFCYSQVSHQWSILSNKSCFAAEYNFFPVIKCMTLIRWIINRGVLSVNGGDAALKTNSSKPFIIY